MMFKHNKVTNRWCSWWEWKSGTLKKVEEVDSRSLVGSAPFFLPSPSSRALSVVLCCHPTLVIIPMIKRFFLCGTSRDKVGNGSFSQIDAPFDPEDVQYQDTEVNVNGDQQDSSSSGKAQPTRNPRRLGLVSKNDVYSFNYALTLKNKEIADLKKKLINFEDILNEKERLERKVQELQFALEQKDDLIRELKGNSMASK